MNEETEQLNNRIIPAEEPEDFKAAYDKIVQIDKIISLETLNPNSVIVIKLGGDEGHRIRMHQAFIKFLNSKQSLFKSKKLTVLFLDNTDDISSISEEDMNKAGWYRKESNLIVNPFSR